MDVGRGSVYLLKRIETNVDAARLRPCPMAQSPLLIVNEQAIAELSL